MTLPKNTELQWQQGMIELELQCQEEIIELWLNTPGIPSDARTGLLKMLRVVKEEMEDLRFHDDINRWAS